MTKKKAPSSVNNQEWKARLLTMRTELEALMAGHEEPRAQPEVEPDVGDRSSRAEAVQDHEMASATTRRRHLEMARIGAALQRLEEDVFGDCVTCGRPIATERLSLDPTTPFCIDHAK